MEQDWERSDDYYKLKTELRKLLKEFGEKEPDSYTVYTFLSASLGEFARGYYGKETGLGFLEMLIELLQTSLVLSIKHGGQNGFEESVRQVVNAIEISKNVQTGNLSDGPFRG